MGAARAISNIDRKRAPFAAKTAVPQHLVDWRLSWLLMTGDTKAARTRLDLVKVERGY